MKVKVGVEVDTNRLNRPTVHTVSLTTASTIVESLTITPTARLSLLPRASCTYVPKSNYGFSYVPVLVSHSKGLNRSMYLTYVQGKIWWLLLCMLSLALLFALHA